MSRLSRLSAGVAAMICIATAMPARAAEVSPVLPAETEAVIFVNVRQMLDSELMKKYAIGQLKQVLEGNDAQKMLKDLGLDPFKDIDRVTAGTWGEQSDMNVVAVIKGNFDLEKMFAAAQAAAKNNGDKIAIVEEGKYKLVKFTNEDSPKPFFATFADDKTIVGATDKKLVVTAREAAEKGGRPNLKTDLAKLVLKQDEKASMYMCGLVEGKGANIPPGVNIPGVDPEKLSQQLASLSNIAVTLRLTEDVALDIDMGMKDSGAADEFGATISQLIGTAKSFLPFIAGQQEQLKPLVDEVNNTLKSKVVKDSVNITLKLSADAIGKAAGGADGGN